MMEKLPFDELPFHQDYVQLWHDMNQRVWEESSSTKYNELSKLVGQYAALNNQFISIFNTKNQRVLYMSPNYLEVLGYTCTEEEYKRWATLYWMRDLPLAQSWFFMQMTLFFKNTVQKKLKAAQEQKSLTWYLHNFLLTPPSKKLRHISITGTALELTPDGTMLIMMLLIKDAEALIKENSPWWAEFTINGKERYIFHEDEKKFHKGSVLSVREREILELIKLGKNTKIIAEHLHISPQTVDKHRKNMIEFTGAKDMSSLIQLCEIGKIL